MLARWVYVCMYVCDHILCILYMCMCASTYVYICGTHIVALDITYAKLKERIYNTCIHGSLFNNVLSVCPFRVCRTTSRIILSIMLDLLRRQRGQCAFVYVCLSGSVCVCLSVCVCVCMFLRQESCLICRIC